MHSPATSSVTKWRSEFRTGNYFGGLWAGVHAIDQAIRGEYKGTARCTKTLPQFTSSQVLCCFGCSSSSSFWPRMFASDVIAITGWGPFGFQPHPAVSVAEVPAAAFSMAVEADSQAVAAVSAAAAPAAAGDFDTPSTPGGTGLGVRGNSLRASHPITPWAYNLFWPQRE